MNLTKLSNRLWAIAPHAFAQVQQSMIDACAPNGIIGLENFVIQRPAASFDEESGVGHVHIQGALGDNMPPIWGMVGNTDYRDVRDEIANITASGAEGLVLHIDSPGGMVSGLEEAGQAIIDANLPTVAQVDGMACSAAYFLAAQADRITATPSSDVGNIGTVLAWADPTGMWESMGVEFNVMTNEGADLKGTFRDSPMTASQREFLQDSLNRHGNEFRATVEDNRDVDPEVFRAGWYSGGDAIALGLIDNITKS